MQMIFLLLIVYFLIGACVCLLICVNPNDPGFLGSMSRFVFKKFPTVFANFVKKIFGDGVLNFLGGIKHYLLETNHPIVQFFYLLIAVGGFGAYQVLGIIKHMPNKEVADWQVITANVLAFICFWTYYKCCATDPGEVNSRNADAYVKKYQKYYDEILYKRNNICKTCKIVKPARSKHCSICKMCVSKYDHHCVWIRQCVGEKNYKYFVSFLGLHSLWCLFLSKIGTVTLFQYLDRIRFWGMVFNIDGQKVPANPFLALQFLFVTQTIFFFLIVMCAIMGFTLLIFVLYHFYLIYKGQTTNERVKKNDQIDYYNKELKAINKFQTKFKGPNGDQIKEVQFRGQIINRQQFQDYKELCKKRLTQLQMVRENTTFFEKLDAVFKA